jgi:hypothetical protein
MMIKKTIKFIYKIKKKPLSSKLSVIIGVRAKSTLIARQKVLSLKKLAKTKEREISKVKSIN